MHASTFSLCLLTLLGALPGQQLRHGLSDADAVLVGRQVGSRLHSESLRLHRVQVLSDIRGGHPGAITVLDWPKLSLHIRPTPRQTRLFCLQDASAQATRLGLPASDGPFFKLLGWPGSHPLIGTDIDADQHVRFARILADAEAGTAAVETAARLVRTALSDDADVRREATRLLAERPLLRSRLGQLHWSQLLARAIGETEDIEYKIALAELCAEQRIDGLLDALAVSLGPVSDPQFARCVGRIGRLLHGEQATARLEERLRIAGQERDRGMLLLAIGATSTRSALDALLRMDRQDALVEAALKEHRAPEAREAVLRRRR